MQEITKKILKELGKLRDKIIQINRVVFETKGAIFNDNTIFKNNLNKSDYEYFKHIRAVFGAHPVNIDEKGTKKYASWLTDVFGDFGFSVLIYDSNKENQSSNIFGFKVDEINKFLWKYVEHLDKIYLQITKKQGEFLKDMKKVVVVKSDLIINQIDVLIEENDKRLNSEHYDGLLKELKLIFSTEISEPQNEKFVSMYRKILKSGVEELYDAIQNIELKDLKVYNHLNPKCETGQNFGYAYGKLTSMIHSEKHEYPFEIIREDLEDKISKDMVCSYNTYEELYVILLTSLYMECYMK